MRGLRIAGLRSRLAGPFDLTIEAGVVAIIGASGSGKSLFLRMIADLDLNEGQVWLDDAARAAMPAPAWRRRVVYNAAESGWWGDSVAEHFPAAAMATVRGLAERLALAAPVLAGPVTRLSSGEKLRLSLIRALLLCPPVLLLDEPTGALDQATTLLAEQVLRERVAGGTILLIATHDPAQPARLGAQSLRMEAGRLHAAAATPGSG